MCIRPFFTSLLHAIRSTHRTVLHICKESSIFGRTSTNHLQILHFYVHMKFYLLNGVINFLHQLQKITKINSDDFTSLPEFYIKGNWLRRKCAIRMLSGVHTLRISRYAQLKISRWIFYQDIQAFSREFSLLQHPHIHIRALTCTQIPNSICISSENMRTCM